MKSVNPTCPVEGTQASVSNEALQNPNQNPISTENPPTPNESHKNASGDDKSNSGKMQIVVEIVDSSLPLKPENPQFVMNLNANQNQNIEAQSDIQPIIEVNSNLNHNTYSHKSVRKSETNHSKFNSNLYEESMTKSNRKRPKLERRVRSKSNFSEDQDESIEINFPPRKRPRPTRYKRNQEISNFSKMLDSSEVYIPKRKYKKRVKGKRDKNIKVIKRKTKRKQTGKKRGPYRCRNHGRCDKLRSNRFVAKLLVLALYLRYLDARKCIKSASII